MTRYLIVKEETCNVCKGDGVVWDSDWKALSETDPRHEMTVQDIDAYWQDKGFSGKDDPELPAEEVACQNCKGAGTLRQEIDLQEALQALGRTQL